jgi:hypothetical protein
MEEGMDVIKGNEELGKWEMECKQGLSGLVRDGVKRKGGGEDGLEWNGNKVNKEL